MGNPAIVQGDMITGSCAVHMIPGPLGAPIPAPPMPFNAPITLGTAANVLIAGRPAATVGSMGMNTPPHVGLHGTDPFLAPPAQMGTILGASLKVLIGGKPAATNNPPPMMCSTPGTITGTAATVLIG